MNKKELFFKYSLEFVVIVIGILISFYIQRLSDEKRQLREINESIATLSYEIQTNINYCDEHLKQLQNMQIVNDSVLKNFETLNKDSLINWHNKHPFGHSYLEDGKLRYWTDESDYDNLFLWMITWWNTFAQNEIYFKSLISSGLLLNIEDASIREDIESVYVTKKKRVEVNEGLLKANSDKIFLWVEQQRDNSKITISRDEIFKNMKNLKLKNLIEDRSFRIELRIMSLKNYLSSLRSLKTKLETKFSV